jgi:hypothetical protein
MRGSITSGRGKPVEDVNVVIAQGPTHVDLAAITGPDGGFDFGQLESGDYVIKAYAAEAESAPIPVRVLPSKVAFVEIVMGADESSKESNVIEEM